MLPGLLLKLLPRAGLFGLRLFVILRTPFRGLGDLEKDEDLPRFGGARTLRGEADLDRASFRTGERLRRRTGGDLFGGLLALLTGGDLLLRGKGERLREGLPRILRGETRAGDLSRRGEGERLLTGEAALLRGGVSPRR